MRGIDGTLRCARAVRFGRFVGAVAIVTCLSIGGVHETARAGENSLPANPAEALAAALPAIEAARPAKAAETPEIAKGIRRAVDFMQPHVKAGSADPAWAKLWNEALTLTRFHGNSPTGEYALERTEVLKDYASVGLPIGRGWSFAPGGAGERVGEITRTPGGAPVACAVRMSYYFFNYTYSGIGGENAAALAEHFFGDYRDSMTEIESRSPKVMAKPLSKSFARANCFEILGTIPKEGRARVRAYFVKNPTMTIRFEAIEYRTAQLTETPAATWQRTVTDPELDAVLASIEEVDPKKRKK